MFSFFNMVLFYFSVCTKTSLVPSMIALSFLLRQFFFFNDLKTIVTFAMEIAMHVNATYNVQLIFQPRLLIVDLAK